ncbi:MAG: hypothetical protein KJ052_03550 [Candidatus Hydrogenedentes bacterium]|nr:hypothetical protein [Candidatus Hydrogenedentota bacterium]
MPESDRDLESKTEEAHTEIPKDVEDLLARIRNDDAGIRTAAWRNASAIGAGAIEPLASISSNEPMEVARAAKRGLWQIVRHCGRPGADTERQTVNAALLNLLSDDHPVALRREVLWMISEIGDDNAVPPVAAFLASEELREDARMALERIPGNVSLDALKSALDTVPGEFKPNIADSLRQRGEAVPGYPSAKLTPVKPTGVTPLHTSPDGQ